jgi:PKHD-type hydroxylase
MLNYYVRQVLDEEQLTQIHGLLRQAETEDLWFNGQLTANGDDVSSMKKNFELLDTPVLQGINDLIMGSLDRDKKFMQFTAAKSSYKVFVSKTPAGGYYNPHTDSWDNGDYSTTLFLNDPDEYEGGELCLYDGGEEENKFKLRAGWAITYPTGMIHRVNKVLAGTRYVSVFWTQSLIKDPFMRSVFFGISNSLEALIKDHPVYLLNCKGAADDPIFTLGTLKSQILRRYADVN